MKTRRIKPSVKLHEIGYLRESVILGLIIGAICGLGAILFYEMLNLCVNWFLEVPAAYTVPSPGSEWGLTNPPQRRWLIPLVTTFGGLISGIIVYSLAPEAEGHGTDAAIAAFHRYAGKVRARVPLIKMIASSITIGSGGSAGREGPMAQVGSGFGAIIASLMKMNAYKRRLAVATGIGAGIGTIFKAPLGGAIFGIEVLYKRDFEVEALIPAFIASVVGYAIFGSYSGWKPIFAIPPVSFRNPLELAFYAVLGVACALVGLVYVKTFYGLRDVFRRLGIPNFLKPMIGGLITGVIGFFFPQILGTGYGWITIFAHGKFPLLLGDGGWLTPNAQLVLICLLVLAILKIAATSFTISSGGSGGVFAPGLEIGALVGAALGGIFMEAFPSIVMGDQAFLTSFIVIGMMALFAGVSKAPIAVILMVSEMTGSYELIAPAMLAIALSYVLTGGSTIYSEQVSTRAHSPAHIREYSRDLLEELRSKDAMKLRFPTASPEDSLRDALAKIMSSDSRGLPVTVDDTIIGILTFEDIMHVPSDRLDRVRVSEVMNRRLVVTYPDESLYEALKKMITHNVGQLPVVDPKNKRKLIGMLTRRDVVDAHDVAFKKLFISEESATHV